MVLFQIVGGLAVLGELSAIIAFLVKKEGTFILSRLTLRYANTCVDAEDQLATAKTEKADIEKQLATLTALKSKLETQTTDINYITGRLDQFANIWSLVR